MMRTPSRRPSTRRLRGLTLVEVLVSMLILLVIFVGILPLFTRAAIANQRGGQATQMATYLISSFEEIHQKSINHSSFTENLETPDDLEKYYQNNESSADGKGSSVSAKLAGQAVPLNPFHLSNLDAAYANRYRGLPPAVLTTGPRTADTHTDHYLGDEKWVPVDGLATKVEDMGTGEITEEIQFDGDILWIRDVLFFGYDLSDVHIGTAEVGSGGAGYLTGGGGGGGGGASNDADDDGLADVGLVQQGHPQRYDRPLVWNERNPPDIREVRVAIRSAISSTPVGTGARLVVGHYRVY